METKGIGGLHNNIDIHTIDVPDVDTCWFI